MDDKAALDGDLPLLFFFLSRPTGQGSLPEAIRAYREAVQVGEKNADVYYGWGNLAEAYYWAPGERNNATETYRRAIALATERLRVNPRNPDVLAELALYHAMLLEKDPALERIRQALEFAPTESAIHLVSAKVHVQFGQYTEAIAALQRARKLGTSAYVVRDDPEFRLLAADVQYQNVARP